jgi:starvation-inducible DNA-binding protein
VREESESSQTLSVCARPCLISEFPAPGVTRTLGVRPENTLRQSAATSIDLASDKRGLVVGLLNQQLANVSDLYSQTKQAHWNVRGPEFYGVHKLFDDLAAPLQEMIDELAERAVTIGGFALGTVRCAANMSELEEFPLEPGAMEYVQELAKRYATVANSVRQAVEQVTEAGDLGTADLLTDLSRNLDKSVYYLEAHFRE